MESAATPVAEVSTAAAAVAAEPAADTEDRKRQKKLDFFSWMQLSPPSGSPCFNTLHASFPGALPGDAVLQRSIAALAPYGLAPGNTIYGQSICPDEINNEPTDLAALMAKHWGNCFPMGGLGGAPFVGKTGFGAFSGHVPDNGNVVILFGPHIAISESGELGAYKRVGQSKISHACGAVLGAYEQCKASSSQDDETDELDMQQAWLRKHLRKEMSNITCQKEPLQAVMLAAYEAVKEKLLKCVNTDFGTGKLVLIGGIQINMPAPSVDHFQPLCFTVTSADQVATDILHEFKW